VFNQGQTRLWLLLLQWGRWPSVNKTGTVVMLLTAFCQMAAQAEVLQDPMAPPGYGASGAKSSGTKTAPQWILTSTLIATDRRLANINGTLVSVGKLIDGAQVTAIEPDYVRLRKGNKDMILELSPKDIKQVAKGTQP